MFPNVTESEWVKFFDILDKIMKSEEGSESERFRNIWERSQDSGNFDALIDFVDGLIQVRDAANDDESDD